MVYSLTNAIFDIPLLYYYSNLRLSIIFYLSSGDISFFRYFLGISLSFSFVTFSRSFWQFFYFLIFRYYTILILFLVFFLEICFSLGISLSLSFITVSELFCCEFFKTFVILKQHIYHFFFFKFILSKRLSNSLWG